MVATDDFNKRVVTAASGEGLMTTRDVMARLNLSRVGVWRITNKTGSDFPKAILLGPKQKRWVRSEVEDWLRSRPRSAT